MADEMKRTIVPEHAEALRAAHGVPGSEAMSNALGVKDNVRVSHRINEITQLLYLPESFSEDEITVRLARAIELYESLAPTDGAEAMLAQQMVGTHHAALECLRRAALPNQSFEGRDMALRHASKLMSLYEKQMSALNKSRGKGQQKVTVEHVHVAAGGQAIVGNVEAGAPPTRRSGQTKAVASTSPALENSPDAPAPFAERSPNTTRGRGR
ncbi:MAG: hypothetical protein QNJ13_08605 [Paracoccaceae bacterium]|nr:hypothetical protein [Paracoccaceae bacterium]